MTIFFEYPTRLISNVNIPTLEVAGLCETAHYQPDERDESQRKSD
jgi:hypothetical protein